MVQLMRQGSFYEELSFQHYLQHYSGTKKKKSEIQSCLQVHQQVRCDKIILSSIAIKSYKYQQEIAFRPVSNSFLLYPSLMESIMFGICTYCESIMFGICYLLCFYIVQQKLNQKYVSSTCSKIFGERLKKKKKKKTCRNCFFLNQNMYLQIIKVYRLHFR